MAIGDEHPKEVIVPILEMEGSGFVEEERKRSESTPKKDSKVIKAMSIQDLINVESEKVKFASAKEQVQRDKYSSQTSKTSLIQTVPRTLIKELKLEFKNSFEPRVVAIGPFHRGNPKLADAEEAKFSFAALFADENETSDEDLRQKIMAEIKNLRDCYDPKDIERYSDGDLSWMFFVDGCAVLYAIYAYRYPSMRYREILSPSFYVDLLLLENQLPYRVLQILIDSTTDAQLWNMWVDSFIYEMAATVLGGSMRSAEVVRSEDDEDQRHLLHKFWTQLVEGEEETGESSNWIGRMLLWFRGWGGDEKTVSGAKNLVNSGILLRRTEGKSTLRNISFHCEFPAILKMPILHVDDSTPYLFNNLLALESCFPDSIKNRNTVKSYLGFLTYLIQAPEDVKQLRKMGLLKHQLTSDDDVTALFRQMGSDLSLDPKIRHFVTERIDMYCSSRIVNYFGAQWSFVTFLGVMGELIMSLVQTYFAIQKYLRAEKET